MKYAVLLLALMLAGCGGGSSTVGYEIKINGRTIQVAKEDFHKSMSWDDAMAACQNLGNGWRLPNEDELGAMHEQLHTKGKGNFLNDGFYWGSSQGNPFHAWYLNFDLPLVYGINSADAAQVRAVRDLP